MFEIINTLTLVVMATAVAYFMLAIGLGVRELRRRRIPLSAQAELRYGDPFRRLADGTNASLEPYALYFLIPCLNEAAVIGDTVAALHDPSRQARVVVIDDGSDDRTAERARAAAGDAPQVVRLAGTQRRFRFHAPLPDDNGPVGDEPDGDDAVTVLQIKGRECRVHRRRRHHRRRAGAGVRSLHVVRRELPDARHGKGAALNCGFAHVAADARARGLAPEHVIVVVMDADGQLSDGAIAEALPLFDDPTVGAVQLAVRIRNRATNFLLRFQDHQFWALSSLTQFGRISTSTVSLGGNGQFARLSALLELGDEPWSSSLTEDLDLSVSLAVAGWRLVSTPTAAVDQQGVATLRALIRQRTRWYQGHMTAGRRLPEVFQSRHIGHAAAIEMSLYLLVPWLFDLPWSILYHVVLVELALNASHSNLLPHDALGKVLVVGVWYLLGFWPALVTTAIAKARDREMSWPRAVELGHAFVITNYISYLCAWQALYRILVGYKAWAKTERLPHAVATAPSARPAGAEALATTGAADAA